MAGTVRTEAYGRLIKSLVDLRATQKVSQADLATRLGKPPSFVGKYELGERRLDVIELFVILRALDVDPLTFLKSEISSLPETL